MGQVQNIVETLSKVCMLNTSLPNPVQKVDLYIAADTTSYNSNKANELRANGASVVMTASPSSIISSNIISNGSGTSVTFESGGYVICESATNLTISFGSTSRTFSGYVGIMPVGMNVKASGNKTFSWHKF